MTDARGRARELRATIVAVVAGVYIFAWTRVARAPEEQTAPSASAAWLDELPSEQRPAVTPPAGWRVANRGEIVAPIPRRVPASNPSRLRTRSS